ncbi:MAG: aspartate aminotransferase family protein [Gemmatimonadetes bacterium]|nr:aspartate aminotransferase family protein [Gemmatimonadota bacterium]
MTIVEAGRASSEIRREYSEHVFPCVKPYYREPLVLAEGSGSRVRDADGVEYLDLFSGILTTSVGHCHPEVVERVREQIGALGHTSGLYITEAHATAARKLASLMPGTLRKVFFTNSGTEAIETAIMIARMHTGRTEIVALRHAYSGRSTLASGLTAHAAWRPLGSLATGISHAMAPYFYRSPFDASWEESGELFARDIEDVIQTATSGQPAAFIAEAIQGVGGYIVPPPGYFQRAAGIIRDHGGLFIVDEVQTGFGRTGRWWGIQNWDVVPDIMVMAKGIANGFPVGATVTTDEIAAAWKGKTISTFGGNPICMAAVEATLDIMIREDVPRRAAERGQQLRRGLDALAARHAWIGDVRGMGLMQALEIVKDRATKQPDPTRAGALLEATRAEGVLVGVGGLNGHVMRIGPQLLISAEEIDEGLTRLGRACDRVA